MTTLKKLGPLFSPGKIVATPGAMDLFDENVRAVSYIKRHLRGDWGDMSEHDKKENELSIDKYLRILSAYETPNGRLWILTEADRSVTTLMLPSEY